MLNRHGYMLVRGMQAHTLAYNLNVGQDGFCRPDEVWHAFRMPATTVMRMAKTTEQALHSHEIADLLADMTAKENSDQVDDRMDHD